MPFPPRRGLRRVEEGTQGVLPPADELCGEDLNVTPTKDNLVVIARVPQDVSGTEPARELRAFRLAFYRINCGGTKLSVWRPVRAGSTGWVERAPAICARDSRRGYPAGGTACGHRQVWVQTLESSRRGSCWLGLFDDLAGIDYELPRLS